MSHTKGPWTNENNIIRTDDACICQVFYCKFNGDHRGIDYIETEANARLIAAAPALLDACEELLLVAGTYKPIDMYDWERVSILVDQARATVRKARGE